MRLKLNYYKKKMEKVFCVHSNFTYLTSLSIIDKEKINASDVVFLTFRGFYPNTNKYKTYKLKQLWAIDDKISYLTYLKGVITWLIWYFSIFQTKGIEVYVPNSRLFPCYLFSKISLVRKYYYIDEGSLYYTNIKTQFEGARYKHSFLAFIFYLIKGIHKNQSYFLSGVDGTYAFWDRANNSFEKITYLKFNPSLLPSKNQLNITEKSIILVIDGLSALHFIEHNQYMNILETITKYIQKEYSKYDLYYKMHPSYFDKPKEAVEIKELLHNRFKNQSCIEIAYHHHLEIYIGKSHIIMLTGISTIGLICYLSGSNYKSYLKLYIEHDLLSTKIKSLPDDFISFSIETASITN